MSLRSVKVFCGDTSSVDRQSVKIRIKTTGKETERNGCRWRQTKEEKKRPLTRMSPAIPFSSISVPRADVVLLFTNKQWHVFNKEIVFLFFSFLEVDVQTALSGFPRFRIFYTIIRFYNRLCIYGCVKNICVKHRPCGLS